jgi:hypothetical protein
MRRACGTHKIWILSRVRIRKIDIQFQISGESGFSVAFPAPCIPEAFQNISSYFRLDIPNYVLYMFFRVMDGRKTAVKL